MYGLIGSLVIMHDREAGALTGMFTHMSRFKYGQFRCQMGFQKTVHMRFGYTYIRRMCFICQVRLGRSYWTSPCVT